MSEKGYVFEMHQDRVKVKLTRKEACAKCGACIGLSEQEMMIVAENRCDAKVGDTVYITLENITLFINT